MPGPAPKHPSTRARRNTSPTARTFASDVAVEAPDLPEIRSNGWHVMTLAWWADLWKSPMAAEYLQVDSHALIRMALLIDDYWRKPSHYLAAEIRQQEQRFGLTPLDRRRLEWSIEQAEDAKDRGHGRRERAAKPQPTTVNDPRNVLRAV